jgi:hypothetical protein
MAQIVGFLLGAAMVLAPMTCEITIGTLTLVIP